LESAPAGRVALDDGQRPLTYGELRTLVVAEGAWLAGAGGERYATLADNGTAWVVTDIALHLREMLSVPLPGYFTTAQALHALDDAGIDSVLTDDPRRAHDTLVGWRHVTESPQTGLSLFRRQLDAGARPRVPPGTVKVTYTSGSTAAPKGVCLSARHLETVAQSLAAATAPLGVQRHLCLLPLATLLENVAGIYAPLLAGATCVLPPATTTGMSYAGPDPQKLLATVSAVEPESLILVPELLQLLVVSAERGWRAPRSLKFIAVGGASVSPSLLERAAAAGLPVYEGYGLSECASVVCLNAPHARRPGSVGKPLPHARVRLAANGEVRVSGSVMLGYLGDPPRAAGDELATGDLGEVDDEGYFYIRGRVRNIFITSLGRNVAPEWVEREINQRLPRHQVMVFGEARPHAVALVSAPQSDLDAAGIERAIASANAQLPDYARVRRWARVPEPFTLANGLLTSNGRLRRTAILERHRGLLDALYREELAS
jgi:long-subunit acyl-CoA synthetase (AMP-forming)